MNLKKLVSLVACAAVLGPALTEAQPPPSELVAPRPTPQVPPPQPSATPVPADAARVLYLEGMRCFEIHDYACADDRLSRSYALRADPVVAYALSIVADARGDSAQAESYRLRIDQDPAAPPQVRAAVAQRRLESRGSRPLPDAPRAAPDEAPEDSPTPQFTSDRPGYSNSTAVAALHVPTTEFGFDVTADDGVRTLTFPTLSIRVGLTEWLEFRLKPPSFLASFVDGPGDEVFVTDTVFGFKVGKQVTDTLSLSLVPEVTIPTSGGAWQGRLELNWALGFGVFGLNGNLAFGSAPSFTGRDITGEASLTATFQATEALGVFAQTFVLWTRDQDPRPFAGAGIYAMVHERIQMDLTFDVGLTDAADSRLRAGGGMTVLWN